MIKPHSREQCSAEAVEPEGEILLCQRHLALAMELVNARVDEARRGNARISIPAGRVGQAWRDPTRQARLASLLRLSNVEVVALDDAEARRVGLLLAARRGRDGPHSPDLTGVAMAVTFAGCRRLS